MAQRQYLVPQFIDVEDKIIGPITVRQFVICLVAVLFMFIAYQLAVFWLFVIEAAVIAIVFGIIAFLKVNGVPFHFFMLNLLQTKRRPRIRIWDKDLSDADLKAYINVKKEKEIKEKYTRKPVTSSRLSQLSLIVNTGGVFRGDEEENTSLENDSAQAIEAFQKRHNKQ